MSKEAVPFHVDAAVRRGAPQPVSDTLCIWDIRDFDDGGCFGKRVPAGWFREAYPFVGTVIMMTFTGGKGYNEWVTRDEAGRLRTDFTVPVRILRNVLRQGVRPMVVLGADAHRPVGPPRGRRGQLRLGKPVPAPGLWGVRRLYPGVRRSAVRRVRAGGAGPLAVPGIHRAGQPVLVDGVGGGVLQAL